MATEQVDTGDDGELFLSVVSNGNASTPHPLSVTFSGFSTPPLTPSPPDERTLFVAGGDDDDVVTVTDEAVGGVTGGCDLRIGG